MAASMKKGTSGKRKSGIIKTVLALFLVVVLLALALLVPDAVNGWYDDHTLGLVEYTDMRYESYEIVAYESFEEELEALAACRERGIELYQLQIEESEDEPDDEELLAIVNEELESMYRTGFFGKLPKAESIVERWKGCIYPLGDCRDFYPQKVYLWWFRCELSDGWIYLYIDCAFHKIFQFRYYEEGDWDDELFKWRKSQYGLSSQEKIRLWYDYWGVTTEKSLDLLMRYSLDGVYNEKLYWYNGMQIFD